MTYVNSNEYVQRYKDKQFMCEIIVPLKLCFIVFKSEESKKVRLYRLF